MSRIIHCLKLNKEAEGLDTPPFPTKLGQRIFESISKEAWKMWLSNQTMLINENHLNLMDPNTRKFLEQQMENFLFLGKEIELPEGFKTQK